MENAYCIPMEVARNILQVVWLINEDKSMAIGDRTQTASSLPLRVNSPKFGHMMVRTCTEEDEDGNAHNHAPACEIIALAWGGHKTGLLNLAAELGNIGVPHDGPVQEHVLSLSCGTGSGRY